MGLREQLLIAAARSGPGLLVKGALLLGPDVNATDARGMTPLMWAARNRRLVAVRLLLACDVNVDAQDREGETALAWAARCDVNGDPAAENWLYRIVGNFLSYDATPDTRNGWGASPLMYAARSGQINTVKSLTAMGADINGRDNEGKSPLDYAREGGDETVLAFLKEKGAS